MLSLLIYLRIGEFKKMSESNKLVSTIGVLLIRNSFRSRLVSSTYRFRCFYREFSVNSTSLQDVFDLSDGGLFASPLF